MSLLNLSHSYNRIWGTLIRQIHKRLSIPISLVKVTDDEELIKKLNSSLPDEFLIRNSRLTNGNSIYDFEILGIIQGVITLPVMIKLYVRAVNEEGHFVKHMLMGYPDGPSRARLLNMKAGDIALIQGNVHLQKGVEEEQYFYHRALKLFSAYKVGTNHRNFTKNTYSQATLLGRVIGEFVATPDLFYEGYVKVMTWREKTAKHAHGQTSRVMVSKEVMGRFSFMKEVTVGEKLMVNGVLDYISVPNVKGNLLVISAKEVLRVDKLGKCNGEVLSSVST